MGGPLAGTLRRGRPARADPFYVGMLLLPAVTVFALFQVSVAGLVLSLVYFILGYLLFAGLMAGTPGLRGRGRRASHPT